MRRETAKNVKDRFKFVKTLFTKEKGGNLKTSSQEPETQKESSRCAVPWLYLRYNMGQWMRWESVEKQTMGDGVK